MRHRVFRLRSGRIATGVGGSFVPPSHQPKSSVASRRHVAHVIIDDTPSSQRHGTMIAGKPRPFRAERRNIAAMLGRKLCAAIDSKAVWDDWLLFNWCGALLRRISASVPLSILAFVRALEGARSDAGDDTDSGNGKSDDGNNGSRDRKPNHFLKHAASRGERNGAGWGFRLPLTL